VSARRSLKFGPQLLTLFEMVKLATRICGVTLKCWWFELSITDGWPCASSCVYISLSRNYSISKWPRLRIDY